MTHYLENFTEFLPQPPEKIQVISDYMERARNAGIENFILLDRGITKRTIDLRVQQLRGSRFDESANAELIEAGFSEHEIGKITGSYEAIDAEILTRVRALVLTNEARDCAEYDFADKTKEYENMLKGISAKQEVVKIVQQVATKPPLLAGPATLHAVDELVSALHTSAPWMRHVSKWVHKEMRAKYGKGQSWLNLSPVLLVGPPGLGKSTYARALGRLAGTPVRALDAVASNASFAVAGADSTWASAQAGIPLQEIAKTGIANPIMIVDEIDKAGHMKSSSGQSVSLPDALLGLLEPSSSSAWECPYTRRVFNMSNISWILTANYIENVPAPLIDRCRVFNIDPPEHEDIVQLITEQCAGKVFDEVRDVLIARVLATSKPISIRRIQKMVEDAADVMSAPILH